MSYHWSKADEKVGEGFVRIAREQIGKAASWAENTSESAEKRVHEARRRCKKLRALFRLVRPGFDRYGDANTFVRDAARDLGSLRDTRVLHATLSDLLKRAGMDVPSDAQPPHDETDAETTGLARFAARMRELEKETDHWHLGRMDIATLAKGLKHTYRQGRRTRQTALRHRTDEAFHDWRKYAKYHWNQLGLLEECAPDILPSAQHSAGELADRLGTHHDLALLEQVLGHAPETLHLQVETHMVRSLIEARQAELEDQIEVLGRQVFAETPKALEARFAAYLSGWAVKEATS